MVVGIKIIFPTNGKSQLMVLPPNHICKMNSSYHKAAALSRSAASQTALLFSSNTLFGICIAADAGSPVKEAISSGQLSQNGIKRFVGSNDVWTGSLK